MILEDVTQIDSVFLEEVLGIGLFTQFTICKCTAHFELRISCYKLTHHGLKDPPKIHEIYFVTSHKDT